MIAAWILYALLVGSLVGAGALAVENLLRAHRLPTRWVWAGAMMMSLFWPLAYVIWWVWPRVAPAVPIPDPTRVTVLDPLAVQVTQESFLRTLDGPILVGWALATTVLLVFFVLLILRTRRIRREWRGEEAGGHPVLFSEDLGPAVVGYISPEIVLPFWCRELEDHTLKLILDHELEHLKAGDLRLILTAGILPLLLPWHLPLWWQFKRLRLAAEGDCDLRVVRKYPHLTRPYLELLLEVGGKLPRAGALVAMLSEPEETLERRIRIMTMPFPRKPWIRGLLLTAVGGFFVALACWAPGPSEVVDPEAELNAVELPPPAEVAGDPTKISAAPTFTPYTVRPDIKNRAEIARALEAEFPPLLRGAGIGGTVLVWIFVDESGEVARLMVNESSGHQALDEAALRVASAMEFTPALNEEKAVPVWISLPIRFATDAQAGKGPPEVEVPESELPPVPTTFENNPVDELEPPPLPAPPKDVAPRDIQAAPTFTPYTVRPDIRNRADVARAMEDGYPPLLRDAGIGGTTQVWFFIDQSGVVQKTQVNQSSGHQALDDAALEVAGKIRFTAALNDGEPVPVWISLPITFTVR